MRFEQDVVWTRSMRIEFVSMHIGCLVDAALGPYRLLYQHQVRIRKMRLYGPCILLLIILQCTIHVLNIFLPFCPLFLLSLSLFLIMCS